MKRIGNIFERVIDPENLRLAFMKASRGKRHRDDQRSFERNLESELWRLREGLIKGDYPIGNYRRFMIYDPKEREICAASFGERVLHHALMNVCEPYFESWLVPSTYACRIGKGQLAAVKRSQLYARRNRWFMKCDFRKYFDSIPHDGIRKMITRKFKDRDVVDWLCRILDSYEKTPDKGLPIGNLTSQHFANLYLDRLDRHPVLKGLDFVRYMDDFVVWTNDKSRLLDLRRELTQFCRDELGLEFKQIPFINRTDKGMDFLGLRVFPSAIRLNRASRVRYARRLSHYERMFAEGAIDDQELQGRVTALTAFIEQADTLGWRRHHLATRKEHRATTASTVAAVGTTTLATAARRIATGTTPATATTTWASASVAPQHRRIIESYQTVPAGGRFPQGTNSNWSDCPVGSAEPLADSQLRPFFTGGI